MSMSNDPLNPYAPPKSAVLEAARTGEGEFVRDGQKVAAMRGVAWFGEAWTLFKASPGIWILIFLTFVVISVVLALVPFFGSLISNLLYPVITAGLMIGCRDIEQGQALRFEHFIAGFKKNTGNLVLIGALYLVGIILVAVAAGFAAALMFPLFMGNVAPGGGDLATVMAVAPMVLIFVLVMLALMLPLIMAIWFAPAIVVFHDAQPMEAMRASFLGCLKNMVPFLLYGVVGLLLAVLAALPLLLGFLVFSPVIWASMYTGYRDIFIRHD